MKDREEPSPVEGPEEYRNVDPLREAYRASIVQAPERFREAVLRSSALLCIDLQYLDAAPGEGVFAESYLNDVPPEAQEYYFRRLDAVVLPNVRKLQDCFRARGLEVIHVRIQALTRDGRDRSPGHRKLGLLAAPGSREAEFLELVAPQGDEIVINKTASGVFNASNLEYVLRNLEIDSLYVVGVYTDECVSTTIRDASDRGFYVTLVEDGCATVTVERHEFTVATLRDRYTRVVSSDEAVREIGEGLATTG